MSESVRTGGTYRTLEEQREALSPAEERFERGRQTIGLFLGPVVFLVMYRLDTAERHRLRFRHDPDNQDGPFRGSLRHYRCDPHSARRHRHGPTCRTRVS